jgi:hypothetical protein
VETARLADYAIWGVALLLYVYDAARLLGPHDMMLVEAGRAHLTAALADDPFGSRTRSMAFAPLHLPHRGVFVATWGRLWSDDAALTWTLESLARLRASLGPLRVLAAVAGVLLFIVGPALTAALGPDAAVVGTAVALYPTAAAAVAVLWWRRCRLELTPGRAAVLTAEVLICPAFLPNLVRKITGHRPLDVDGAQLLLATVPDAVKGEFLARLTRRTEALLEEDTTDVAEHARLRAYLATLEDER